MCRKLDLRLLICQFAMNVIIKADKFNNTKLDCMTSFHLVVYFSVSQPCPAKDAGWGILRDMDFRSTDLEDIV